MFFLIFLLLRLNAHLGKDLIKHVFINFPLSPVFPVLGLFASLTIPHCGKTTTLSSVLLSHFSAQFLCSTYMFIHFLLILKSFHVIYPFFPIRALTILIIITLIPSLVNFKISAISSSALMLALFRQTVFSL